MVQKPIVLDAPKPEPRARSAESLQAEILEKLTYSVGKDPCGYRAQPAVWLATATTPASGSARADGTIEPLVKNRLVYVMVWTTAGCVSPHWQEHPTSTIAPASCWSHAQLVDADTGTALFGVGTNHAVG